VEKIMCTL